MSNSVSSPQKPQVVQKTVPAKTPKSNKKQAESDDARGPQELASHANARLFVVSQVESNKLGVDGNGFRVKRNPVGEGCFVYEPQTRFSGVERLIVWWVPNSSEAYALNSPSKMVTPALKLSRDAIDAPTTSDVVGYVFHGIAMSKPTPRSKPVLASYTVREYKIYRAVMDGEISEEQALQNTAEKYGISVTKVNKTIEKVQNILDSNGWFGSAESEIRRATDWQNE